MKQDLIQQIEVFFTYTTFRMVSIDSLIKKEEIKIRENPKYDKKQLRLLKAEKKNGEYKKSENYFTSVKAVTEFEEYYNQKIEGFKKDFPSMDDFDFIKWHSNKCKRYIQKLENVIDDEDPNQDKDFDYYFMLLNKWLSFIKKIKGNLMISNDDFFQRWRSKNKMYDYNNSQEIKEIVSEYIKERFNYFIKKYKTEWHTTLANVYNTITECNYKIDNYHIHDKRMLRIEIETKLNYIEISLNEFSRFFEFLIANQNPKDCLKVLNLFREIMVTYSTLLRNKNFYFEDSYFFETLHFFYQQIEEKYNAQRLKKLSFSIKNSDNPDIEKIDEIFYTNNFNKELISVSEIKNHFANSLKKYADEQIINTFLYQAFQLCEPPKIKLIFRDLTRKKGKIKKVFHTFYQKCGATNQAEYVNLLVNYFNGFSFKDVSSNWSKG